MWTTDIREAYKALDSGVIVRIKHNGCLIPVVECLGILVHEDDRSPVLIHRDISYYITVTFKK